MNSRLNSLTQHKLANVVAYAVVATGLVKASTIRSDLDSWIKSAQTEAFGDFLVATKRIDKQELAAIMTIADRTSTQTPETIQEEISAWLRGEVSRGPTRLLETRAEEDNYLLTSSPRKSPHTNGAENNESAGRFTIVSPHRAGGLGEVFIAQDTQFNRQVALKRIKSQFAEKPQFCNRFLVEAEVTGGLEHPGIVPVYGLGQSEDGTPYYAMKFVQGQSLGDALKSFFANPNCNQNSIEFRKLLRRFATVCYTIHYSHSRGILHRDIKPDNIMLGDFDETLVVDWGIAKVIGSKVAGKIKLPKSELLYPASKDRKDNTQLGQVVGTPGYMSGEQALGWHDSLAPQSDVFSLGATLYAMLVGRPPFGGRSFDEILQNTIAGNFETPRQINSSVPKSLEAICLKAMRSTKSARYPTALAMAEDIEAYLADERVSAWQEPFSVLARRWMRKHKTAVTTGGAGLILLTVGAVVATALLASANTREAAAREKATGNFIIAKSVVDDFLKQLAEDPRLELASLEGLTSEMLTKAENLQDALGKQNQDGFSFDVDRADTEQRIAAVASKLGQTDKAIKHLESARNLLTPHLDDTEDAARARELMTQVMLDYGGALDKVGKAEQSIAVHEDALKLAEKRILAKTDPSSALIGKILHLTNKDIAQRSINDLAGQSKSREQLWQAVKLFFELPHEQAKIHQVEVARTVLNKVALSEQERDKYQEVRLKCVALLEESIKSEADDTLSDIRTKAEDGTALASAYATMDKKKKSYEVGMAAADRWYELAGKTPNVVSCRRNFLWSMYNAFITQNEYEFSAQNAEKGLATKLELKQIKEMYERSAEMFLPFEKENAGNNVGVVIIYAHLLSNFARYLELHNYDPPLVEELLDRAIELQEKFDVKTNKNALLVRNEIMRTAGIHYMTTGQKAKGRDVFERQAKALEKTLSEDSSNFVTHRQLYDLRIVSMILEGAMSADATPEARARVLELGQKAEAAILAIPVDVRDAQVQQVLGMYSRVTAMQHDFFETVGQTEDAQASLDKGVKELLDKDVEMDLLGPVVWVAEMASMSVNKSLDKSDYKTPIPVLDYLLAKVNLAPNARVFALASRAKCHAQLGRPDLAEVDCRSAMSIASRALVDNRLRHAVSSLYVAESIEAKRDKKDEDREKVKFFDDYARDFLLKQFNSGLFEDESFLDFLLDMPYRLNKDSELKPLVRLLEKYRGKKILNSFLPQLPRF